MKRSAREQSLYDGPATYQICVQGHVTAGWTNGLQGMTVRVISSTDGPAVTVLTGALPDQVALSHALNTLYDLHVTVLLVRRLDYALQEIPEAF